MDKYIHIVPFDYDKHYTSVEALLQSSLGHSLTNKTQEQINVLVRTYPTTRSKRPATVFGCIAHKNIGPTTQITELAIDRKDRGKGYGSFLVRHVEKLITYRPAIIFLMPSVGSEEFYERLGYKDIGDPFNENNSIPYMYMGKELHT